MLFLKYTFKIFFLFFVLTLEHNIIMVSVFVSVDVLANNNNYYLYPRVEFDHL